MKKLLSIIGIIVVLNISTAYANTAVEIEVARQAKIISLLVEQHSILINQLKEVSERAQMAEELVKSLRSDTFNLKAQIVQLKGEVNELRENDKGWW